MKINIVASKAGIIAANINHHLPFDLVSGFINQPLEGKKK